MLYGPLCLPKHTSARQIDIRNPVSKSCSPAPLCTHASMRMITVILRREGTIQLATYRMPQAVKREKGLFLLNGYSCCEFMMSRGRGREGEQSTAGVSKGHIKPQSVHHQYICVYCSRRKRESDQVVSGSSPSPTWERLHTSLTFPKLDPYALPSCPFQCSVTYSLFSALCLSSIGREYYEYDTHPGLLADGAPYVFQPRSEINSGSASSFYIQWPYRIMYGSRSITRSKSISCICMNICIWPLILCITCTQLMTLDSSHLKYQSRCPLLWLHVMGES